MYIDYRHKGLLKNELEYYLIAKGIDTKKRFRCLSPDHEDKTPSMSFYRQNNCCHCFSCGVNLDIYDLVGIDFNLHSFPDQYKKVCELFKVNPYMESNNGHNKPGKDYLKEIEREIEKKKKDDYLLYCKMLTHYPDKAFKPNQIHWSVDNDGKMRSFNTIEEKVLFDLQNIGGKSASHKDDREPLKRDLARLQGKRATLVNREKELLVKLEHEFRQGIKNDFKDNGKLITDLEKELLKVSDKKEMIINQIDKIIEKLYKHS